MDSSFDTPQSQPPPGYTGGVWPPPVSGSAQPDLIVPFKTMFLRVSGSVPDFRVGNIEVWRDGVIIRGKAVMPAETQVPVLIGTWFFCLFLPAYIVFDIIKNDLTLSLTWDQILQVVVVPKKRRACLVYQAPNHNGIVKTYSLAFKLNPEQYDAFTSAVNNVASSKLSTGKLRNWQPQSSVIVGIGLCINLLIGLIRTGMENGAPRH